MRARWPAVLECVVLGGVVGMLAGVAWWLLAPTPEWLVTPDGALPVQVVAEDWFAADGWFLILGAVAGVVLTVLAWRRHRARPVLLAGGLTAGSLVLALAAWTVGGVLGPPDPADLSAAGSATGEVVDGVLGVTATGVLLAPALASLTLLAFLLAGAVVRESPPDMAPGDGVPQPPA